jgi:hypothetical protein
MEGIDEHRESLIVDLDQLQRIVGDVAVFGIQCSPRGLRSSAVRTASTPGSALAFEVSMRLIRAWA